MAPTFPYNNTPIWLHSLQDYSGEGIVDTMAALYNNSFNIGNNIDLNRSLKESSDDNCVLQNASHGLSDLQAYPETQGDSTFNYNDAGEYLVYGPSLINQSPHQSHINDFDYTEETIYPVNGISADTSHIDLPEPDVPPIYSTHPQPSWTPARSILQAEGYVNYLGRTQVPLSQTHSPPHFDGYHSLLAGAGRFDAQPRSIPVFNQPEQLAPQPQPPSVTHIATSRQSMSAGMRTQEYSCVDPRVFENHSMPANAPPASTSRPAHTPPNNLWDPPLTHASWGSTTSTPPTPLTLFSVPQIVPTVPASPPMQEVQGTAVAPGQELQVVFQQPWASMAQQTISNSGRRKRKLDEAGVDEHASAVQSRAKEHPRPSKLLRTNEGRAQLIVSPSIGISSMTAAETLTRNTINFEASGQRDRTPMTFVPEGLPVSDAGPISSPPQGPPAEEQEPGMVTEFILKERKRTNKELREKYTTPSAKDGDQKSGCLWDGCARRCTRRSDVVRHVREVHLGQRYVCHCGDILSRRDSLQRHKNTKHPNAVTEDGVKKEGSDGPASLKGKMQTQTAKKASGMQRRSFAAVMLERHTPVRKMRRPVQCVARDVSGGERM